MKTSTAAAFALVLFAGGVGVGLAAKKRVDPATYHGIAPRDAVPALLQAALVQAGKGSWERIAVGRVYYLSGDKAKGQSVFDTVLNDDHEGSDELRIARVYVEAGEWEKARALYDSVVRRDPKDSTGLAEAGAQYLLHGDRAHAEELLDRSFAADDDIWATVTAASAYAGIRPQE
jgi:tetratricopeptide (TPR) repeat protein